MDSLIRRFSKLLVALPLSFAVLGQEPSIDDIDWQVGPSEGDIGGKASISVPQGYLFMDGANTKRFMELSQNLSDGNEYLFAPEDFRWFSVFQFNPVGYVKDDEELDSGALLSSVTAGNAEANAERKKLGWNTLSVSGWRFEPRYDTTTNLLEWAFLAQDDISKELIINYNTRFLGRTGIMEVVLVADPQTLDSAVAEFKSAASNFGFNQGERYAEFRDGDRIAEFGLAALVAGGVAAVATKKGFWAILASFAAATWKFLAVAVVGLFSWFVSLFKRKT